MSKRRHICYVNNLHENFEISSFALMNFITCKHSNGNDEPVLRNEKRYLTCLNIQYYDIGLYCDCRPSCYTTPTELVAPPKPLSRACSRAPLRIGWAVT